MAGVSKETIDAQVNKLKEEKEKKQKGEKYSVSKAFGREDTNKSFNNDYEIREKKIEKDIEKNPFVRRITLDELINISRQKQGKEPVAPQKKTPFVSKTKEISTPTLSR